MCVVTVKSDLSTTPVLVFVAGEIDSFSAGALRDHLQVLPDRDAVLEMSEVTLLSAAGLTVLLELQDRLSVVGARVVLAAASRPARRVLRVIGLDEQLIMAPTVEDAIELATKPGRGQHRQMAAGPAGTTKKRSTQGTGAWGPIEQGEGSSPRLPPDLRAGSSNRHAPLTH